MIDAPQALKDLLASGNFAKADLYTVTLIGGAVLRWTAADVDVVANGHTFSASGPRFERGTVRTTIGLEVDELEITLAADETVSVNGVAFMAFVVHGGFDGALVLLERAFLPDWGEPAAGTVVQFFGRLAPAEGHGAGGRLTVRSWIELLDAKLPRTVYQPGCMLRLYGTRCAVPRADYLATATTAAGATTTTIPCALGQAAGWFDLGVVQFDTGGNAGIKRTVKSYSPGLITLSVPFPEIPGEGDAFTVWPGCDKRQATCQTKFNNRARFRATPYVPVAETAR